MTTLDTGRLVEGMREEIEAFARTVAGGDPEAKVPTCPEWRLRDLVGHIGQAERWAAELVRTTAPLPIPDPFEAERVAPESWARWLRDGAEELIAAVVESPRDAQVWSVLGPAPARFWLRRILCDTIVHRYDASATTGVPHELAGDLAADVLREGLELLSAPGVETFKPELAELRGSGQSIGVRPDGMEGWLIVRTPEGVRWELGRADGDVVVSGPVRELMLVFTRRVPPGRVSGDRALLEHWLANTAF
ncbi:maleylpyruvate isomerase family mycothiol-dependent enzyme [Nonomuraea sp. NPDC050643]|uniref:maleylpyruvate isomerase family mycothiol-dependent enzyme n=1 Tax=Nonomuraea sp. NPDC050643 TaxID=3155660 RepID=UPI00340516B2